MFPTCHKLAIIIHMYHILICDDDAEDSRRLSEIISAYFPEGEADILSFTRPGELYDYMKSRSIPVAGGSREILFLDIIMPGMKGTELAEKLRNTGFSGSIVFLTNSNDFAAESYRVNASSYLLKPAEASQVHQVLARLDEPDHPPGELVIKTKGGIRRILFPDLLYGEIRNHCLFLFLKSGEVPETRMKMQEAAELLLKDRRFIRCHNSFIINMDFIQNTEPKTVVMVNGARLPISKSYSGFKHHYLDYLFNKT